MIQNQFLLMEKRKPGLLLFDWLLSAKFYGGKIINMSQY